MEEPRPPSAFALAAKLFKTTPSKILVCCEKVADEQHEDPDTVLRTVVFSNLSANLGTSALTVHQYYQESDQTKRYPLSPELKKGIELRGWVLDKKIAEGSIADVFLVHNSTQKQAVLLLFGNTLKSYQYNITSDILQTRRFPEIFATVYDHFTLDVPYSDAIEYKNRALKLGIGFGSRTIQVMERVIPFDLYLKVLPPTDELELYVRSALYLILDTLWSKDIAVTDTHTANIGLSFSKVFGQLRIKLIDIEGVHFEGWEEYDPGESLLMFIDSMYAKA